MDEDIVSSEVFEGSFVIKARLSDADISSQISKCEDKIISFIDLLKPPLGGEHVFIGHSFHTSVSDRFNHARALIEDISGLPTRFGTSIVAPDVRGEIVNLIRRAELCIVDISNLRYPDLPAKIDFSLNSSVEAGIAIGAGRQLYLTCRSKPKTPPFMLANREVMFYDSDLELIGCLRRIFKDRHRRQIL